MSKYYCCVESNSTLGRLYEVDYQSIKKAIAEFGRCEFGERITIYRKRSKQEISFARYEQGYPHNNGYVTCWLRESLSYFDPDDKGGN